MDEETRHIMQFFEYTHLPDNTWFTGAAYSDVAKHIIAEAPQNPERIVALRKLLESRDAAMRAKVAP
jgi:hypothetical protein